MKILICTGIYPPDIGGPAIYSNLIYEELKKRGHRVRILTYGDKRIMDCESRITNVGRKHSLPIRYSLYLLQVLKLGSDTDIIYVQDPVSVGLPTALANIFLRKKMILKIVGDYAWEQSQQISNYKLRITNLDDFYPFNGNHSFRIRLLRAIQSWVAARAHKIITPSFYLKNILTKGWGMAEDKIEVIYNSFDINNSLQFSRNYNNAAFKILSVGRLVPWKGFEALIDIVRDIPNVELEIIGDGPEKQNLEFRIRNSEWGSRVKMPGKLPHDEVVQKMCSSDLFILNTAYEGLSHVVLEAMACGLPLAISRAGGNIELAGENEERGYLFEYNNREQIKNKINHIIAHHAESREKADRAEDFICGFTKNKMIDNLERSLQSFNRAGDHS